MKKQPLKYSLNVIGASVIIFLLIRTYIPEIMSKVGLNKNINIWITAYIFVAILGCLLPIIFIENMCDFHPFVFGKKDMKHAHVFVMSGMTILIGAAFLNRIILLMFQRLGVNFPQTTLPKINTPLTFILCFIFYTIVPAVFEELYIRGIVLNLLLPYGRRFAVLVSAFMFMMLHNTINSFLPIFIAGVLLACTYLYTDNIYISMLIHFTNNLYSFLIMFSEQSVNGISSVAFTMYLILIIVGCGISGIMYLRKNNMSIFSTIRENSTTKFTKVFSSPVFVLALFACLLSAISNLYSALA